MSRSEDGRGIGSIAKPEHLTLFMSATESRLLRYTEDLGNQQAKFCQQQGVIGLLVSRGYPDHLPHQE